MNWQIKAPGSCGELLQGTINDVPFLVSSPIDIYTTAYTSQTLEGLGKKATLARQKTMAYLGLSEAGGIRLDCALPQGKGMASSSADIAAVCQLTALMAGQQLSAEEIAQLATEIEPTDGIFFDGIVMFNHLNGICLKAFGQPPPLRLAIFDVGGIIDTVSFNQRTDLAALNRQKEPELTKALQLITLGMEQQKPELVAKACTLSAFANQSILPKPQLPQLYDIAMQSGALGINTAHSGTVLGMMFHEQDTAASQRAIAKVNSVCRDIGFIGTARLIGGGLLIKEEM